MKKSQHFISETEGYMMLKKRKEKKRKREIKGKMEGREKAK